MHSHPGRFRILNKNAAPTYCRNAVPGMNINLILYLTLESIGIKFLVCIYETQEVTHGRKHAFPDVISIIK